MPRRFPHTSTRRKVHVSSQVSDGTVAATTSQAIVRTASVLQTPISVTPARNIKSPGTIVGMRFTIDRIDKVTAGVVTLWAVVAADTQVASEVRNPTVEQDERFFFIRRISMLDSETVSTVANGVPAFEFNMKTMVKLDVAESVVFMVDLEAGTATLSGITVQHWYKLDSGS